MIKVTGPIKLHMKWLSTLSQHLRQNKGSTLHHNERADYKNISYLLWSQILMEGNDLLNAFDNDTVIQWSDFIWTLVQFCKTNTKPREPLLQADL